jgi:predicted house-cleaning noncanonical NTP pyrophosphatase (MazG superfamily)
MSNTNNAEDNSYRESLLRKLEEEKANTPEGEENPRIGEIVAALMTDKYKDQLAAKVNEYHERMNEARNAAGQEALDQQRFLKEQTSVRIPRTEIAIHDITRRLSVERQMTHKFLTEQFRKDMDAFDKLAAKALQAKQELENQILNEEVAEAEFEDTSVPNTTGPLLTHQPVVVEAKTEVVKTSVWAKLKRAVKWFFKS